MYKTLIVIQDTVTPNIYQGIVKMPEPFRFSEDYANNVETLLELCQKFPDEAIDYLIREDFEKWLIYIGQTEFAGYAEKARQASVTDEKKLQQFVESCQNIETNSLEKQQSKTQESTNFLSQIRQMIFGNRQKTREQKLSTE